MPPATRRATRKLSAGRGLERNLSAERGLAQTAADLSVLDDLSEISDFDDALGGNGLLDDQAREVRGLARKETLKVQILRLIVAMCILGAGATITAITYRYLDEEEEKDADASFALLATSLQETLETRFANLAAASRTCVHYISADADSADENFPFLSFPFVTLPHFELYAQEARARAEIEALLFVPVVPDGSLAQMNFYMSENQNTWVQQARTTSGSDETTPYDFEAAIFDVLPFDTIAATGGAGPYLPIWQWSPPPEGAAPGLPVGKQNLAASPDDNALLQASAAARDFVLGPMRTEYATMATRLLGADRGHVESHADTPHFTFAQPLFANAASPVVGHLMGLAAWATYLQPLVPLVPNRLAVVLSNTCDAKDVQSFWLEEGEVVYVGAGDKSDPSHRASGVAFSIATDDVTSGHCSYTVSLYQTNEFRQAFTTDNKKWYTLWIALIFGITALAFFVYDFVVQRRNSLVLQTAAKFNTIVSSLFPSNIRGRLFADKEKDYIDYTTAKSQMKNFLTKGGDMNLAGDNEEDDGLILRTKPMADLFTDTTIMFADICGFTAWSSVREPSQVFILLETVYRAFDQIAKKRRVFKVETVGDCYVAVVGLPDPRADHAVVMARFARECLQQMQALVKRLEVNLGPDTGDLGLRIGLHSGPVTAGVLRGERSRFQLFGDTMNTTARMESTGSRNRIHISQECCDLLVDGGKNHWFEPREDTIVAKGKGAMKTYWLKTQESIENKKRPKLDRELRQSALDRNALDSISIEKTNRLISWNVDVLLRLLKQIVARRRAVAKTKLGGSFAINSSRRQSLNVSLSGTGIGVETGVTVIDEVCEVITLPKLDTRVAKAQEDAEAIELDNKVIGELNEYVGSIASMYRANHFHNFEHASHVTMSVVKLLSRIVAPQDLDDDEINNKRKSSRVSLASLHDHTYGITSDPLTQFACVLSALMHDADHPGVPNAQLVKEETRLSMYYSNKSVAEQNSVDLCWDMLMDIKFRKLRETIYSTEVEKKRFRQLVVNSVMATDIVDKELKTLRNQRWERAFRETAEKSEDLEDLETNVNRKATIVIEHLIQASDVAHTMQHWHIYRKWNERFFMECYKAYQDGRGDKDPSEGWYRGELGFFDFYIIPLAKKLKDCGIFGVSSDEYLQYAQKNRAEWETRGMEIVSSMVEKVQKAPSIVKGMPPRRLVSFDSTDDDLHKRLATDRSVD